MLDRVVAILLSIAAFGTVAQSVSAQSVSVQTSDVLHGVADAGRLADLRWPDFSDYRLHVQNFYAPTGYVPAWIENGGPTRQDLGLVGNLQAAEDKGLNAAHYDDAPGAGR